MADECQFGRIAKKVRLAGLRNLPYNSNMRPSDRDAIRRAADVLSQMLGIPRGAAKVTYDVRFGAHKVDAVFKGGPYAFAIEWKPSGSLGQIYRAVDQIRTLTRHLPDSMIAVLVVPYMGESAGAYCEDAGVAWLDLSGNARLVTPGLYVRSVGNRNSFRRPGRPESAFSPKGSRVARWLLINPRQIVRQRVLASTVGLDEGHVSRVVGKLREMGLVERCEGGIRVADPDRLLDAWHEEYRFDRHTLIRGHIAVAANEMVSEKIAHSLPGEAYAVTGLAAAWYWTQFAGYRLSTVYLSEPPSEELLERLGFRNDPRGANTWIVVPQDQGVFDGASSLKGVRCVHPIQVYLDLKAHPERATEAAQEIRNELGWSGHG